MANIPETPTYEPGVYQIAVTDSVVGGSGGIANRQAQELANRTAWLRENSALRSIAAVTINVDAATGDDVAGDGSAGAPFQTIGRAVEDVPQVLHHDYVIQLAAGVYREHVVIARSGGGKLRPGQNIDQENRLTIRGDPATPDNYRITGADAAADSTPVREYCISIHSHNLPVRLEGLRIDHAATSGVHSVDSWTQVDNLNVVGCRSGIEAELGGLLEISGTINITGQAAGTGSGIRLWRHVCVRMNDGPTVNISEVQVGINSSGRGGTTADVWGMVPGQLVTINVTNSVLLAGTYGVILWGKDHWHNVVLNATRVDVGVDCYAASYIDLDSPSSFTDVNLAIRMGACATADIDAVTFTNVGRRYEVYMGAVSDSRGEASTGKFIHRLDSASDVPDGAGAVAHKLDTIDELVTAGAKLFSVRNDGAERFWIDLLGGGGFAGGLGWGGGAAIASSDAVSLDGHGHDWADITGEPVFTTRWPTWDEVTGKPATFPPSAHTHDDRYYTEAELSTAAGGGAVHWDNVTNKPATFPATGHAHDWADITGEPVFTTRWPTWNEVTGKPATFPPSAHTHDDRYFTEAESDGRYLRRDLADTALQTLIGKLVIEAENNQLTLRHEAGGSGVVLKLEGTSSADHQWNIENFANELSDNLLFYNGLNGPTVRITPAGTGEANGVWADNAFDLAEEYDADRCYAVGTVLTVDVVHDNRVTESSSPYQLVAGVVSYHAAQLRNTAMRDGDAHEILALHDYEHPTSVGLLGLLPVRVTDEAGPIRRRDLLVTSSTPGHAMRGDPAKIIHPRQIVGVAWMEHDTGTGIITAQR